MPNTVSLIRGHEVCITRCSVLVSFLLCISGITLTTLSIVPKEYDTLGQIFIVISPFCLIGTLCVLCLVTDK